MIDLTQLPAPDVIEDVAYETILAEMVADFNAKDPAYSLEPHDPAYKELETAAYREMLVRKRINSAANAVMLPYATSADLDNLAAFYFVARLQVDAGDPNANPPIEPVYESDEKLLERVLLSQGQFSTAGSIASYRYHAMTASANVKGVNIQSPADGQVQVTVLSAVGSGVPDAATLLAVEKALNSEKVRPLTDTPIVQAAQVLNYSVTATLYLYPSTVAGVVQQTAIERATLLAEELHKLGYNIHATAYHAALQVAGVQRVELTAWNDLVVKGHQSAYCTAINVTIGGDDV